MHLSRRSLLIAASLTAAPIPAWARNLSRGAFTHSVASGDPRHDRVILWTRFVPESAGAIAWEIAEDESFATPIAHGEAHAPAQNNYCVKIDARGLQPNRRYFYRFLSASGPSPTGRTRTAPRNGGDSLTVALFSCANKAWGYFHAYGHAAQREDIDLAIHVGDYIYEYEPGNYPSATDALPERTLDPPHECIVLADYYARYANTTADPDLLELRRLKPISAIWDDHEIANDATRDGAQNHQPDTEGAYTTRAAAAAKAFFDWMPIRRSDNGMQIYRSLDWGDLARLALLDTRLAGRDRQLSYYNTLAPQLAQGGAETAGIVAQFRQTVLNDPNRNMLGPEQERWLTQTLRDSKQRGQTWQIIAQGVMMVDQIMPAGITRLLPNDIASITRTNFTASESVGALGLPWNLDSWSGYPAARARMLATLATHANNALVLAGDSHNCWLNTLTHENRIAAVEFAGGSVSSPGFERSLRAAQPGEREQLLQSANPQTAWCDVTRRGYGVLTFTHEACQTEWVGFDNVRSQEAPAPQISHAATEASAQAGPSPWYS